MRKLRRLISIFPAVRQAEKQFFKPTMPNNTIKEQLAIIARANAYENPDLKRTKRSEL